ncbi:MAG TPA: PTS glucose transporter subunit IIA [Mycobacteriales bacterium]
MIVRAPVPDLLRPLSAVPDPVFAGELVGPGLAVEPGPGAGVAVSPVDGRVAALHPHAYVAVAGGRGVRVHLGVDTVRLDGAGFAPLVEVGATVACGQPMVRWDPVAAAAGGLRLICPVVALDATASDLSAPASGPGRAASGSPIPCQGRYFGGGAVGR